MSLLNFHKITSLQKAPGNDANNFRNCFYCKLGSLADAFNIMLRYIQRRDEELIKNQKNLKQKVEERARQLAEKINDNYGHDIGDSRLKVTEYQFTAVGTNSCRFGTSTCQIDD
ncbi:MAG: hypothetical protein GY694_07785 [Gammaproteobacteria bacterium]|nr:hypothetical protein [Gammaproteobacteria bacterium]